MARSRGTSPLDDFASAQASFGVAAQRLRDTLERLERVIIEERLDAGTELGFFERRRASDYHGPERRAT